jgi:NAD(P)-dependent dehydrogenase (short-subunit alcohol dehydrogenase family)/acyl carrier protein
VVTSVGTTKKVAEVKHLVPGVEVVVARGAEIPDALHRAGYRGFDWIISTVNGAARTSLMSLVNNRGNYVDLGKPGSADESFLVQMLDGNKRYHVIDTDQISVRDPDWFSHYFDRMVEKIADPANLVPVSRYPINEMPKALQDLSQGETTGCVTIDMRPDYRSDVANAMHRTMDPDGLYLVTGGYGAVGLVCAHWLASRGARQIVLTGSSGKPNDGARANIDLLKAGGVDVSVLKSDAGDRESLENLMSLLTARGKPVRGVIHAAGVTSDGPFDAIDADRIARSFGPKLQGAYNLTDALAVRNGLQDLEFFLFTSSVSSVTGLSIQGTYASANAGLDGLAENLRSRGINACAIQLGPVEDSGMAESENVQRYLTTIGLLPVSKRRLFAVFDLAVAANVPHFVADDIDWAKNCRGEPSNITSSLLRHIVADALSGSGQAELENLLSLEHKDRTEVLAMTLQGIFAETLGVEEGYLNEKTSFSSMGIDSLSIMEVQVGLNEILQQDLPLGGMFVQDGTIGELAGRISEYLGDQAVVEPEEVA